MAQSSISQGASKTDFGEHNRPVPTPNVSKYAYGAIILFIYDSTYFDYQCPEFLKSINQIVSSFESKAFEAF